MRHFRYLIILLLGISFTGALVVQAQAGADGAFSFLSIGEGARPAGMGEAFTALPDDASSLYWNPAGLSGVYSHDFTSSYFQYLAGVNIGYAGYAVPAQYLVPSLKGGLGIGVMYVDYGAINELSFENPYGTQGSYRPYDLVVTGAYGTSIDKSLSVGMSMKLAHEEIKGYTAQAIAADAGVIYKTPYDDLTLGFTLQNIGFQTKAFVDEYHALPLTYKIGAGYSGLLSGSMKLAVDFYRLGSNSSGINCGAEYLYKRMIFLRLGYQTRGQDLKTGAGSDFVTGFTTGLGVKYDCLFIDYAFVPRNALGVTQRISLSVRFDKKPPNPVKQQRNNNEEPKDAQRDNPYANPYLLP